MGTNDHTFSCKPEDATAIDGAPAAGQAPAEADGDPYYLAHFDAVLAMVQAQYGFLLAGHEAGHAATLSALPRPARMLYARLANRRGPVFRRDKLVYPEITDLDRACADLAAAGLLLCVDERDDPALILDCFTLDELAPYTAAISRRGGRPAFIARLLDSADCAPLLRVLCAQFPLIRLAPGDPWPFLRFLFFGGLRENLSDFVTRDLGYRRPETIAAEDRVALFTRREEACDAYRLACLYQRFRAIRDLWPVRDVLAWWQGEGIARAELAAGVEMHDRLIQRLGRRLEKAGERDAAIALYAHSETSAARERRVRLLLAEGRKPEAEALLQRMAAAPSSAVEGYRAEDLLTRLGGGSRTSAATTRQKAGRTLIIPGHADGVEAAALAHYRALGWQGVHGENWLWAAAFGLIFWDIIYDGRTGAFHSPLQYAPSDLYKLGFYERRRDAIEARLQALADPVFAEAQISSVFAAKRGIANPFLSWDEDCLGLCRILLARLPSAGLQAILRRMAQDVRHHTSGFPDLFLWNNDGYAFIEIKSLRDRLSAKQYHWLQVFKDSGLIIHLDNVRLSETPLPADLPKPGSPPKENVVTAEK